MLLTAAGLGIARGERMLLRSVALNAAPGEAIVLRGANGSGKTTLLRLLAGLTRPDAGEVTRHTPHHWVGHRDGLKPHETPLAHLRLWAGAWGATAQIDPILARMALSRPANVPARFLSAGQRRRTALGRLLLEHRALWLLDEPFTALDADGAALMRTLITGHLGSGGAVIAALHGEAGFPVAREMAL